MLILHTNIYNVLILTITELLKMWRWFDYVPDIRVKKILTPKINILQTKINKTCILTPELKLIFLQTALLVFILE